MKTDNLFYHIFNDLPEAFFALIGLPESEARGYVFKSVELKQAAFRIDATFQPKDEARPMYFVEVQFQRDEKFYRRFFAETVLYLHQYEVHDWRGVVIFPNQKIEPSFKNYEEFIESGRVRRIYLDQLPKTEPLFPQLEIFRVMIADEQETLKTVKAILSETGSKFWEILEKILASKFSNLTREEIEKMLKLETNLMKTRYYRQAREEAIKEGRKEGLEQGLQEGLRQGLQEGLEQGLNEGKRQMTEEIAKRMLEENLPIELVAKTTGLSKRKVQQLHTSKSSETNDRARKKQNSPALKTRRRYS
ncbi:MAG: Rpn family recombination-promoting nuclease/putative transposase [Chloroherpetonaceae bacterium]